MQIADILNAHTDSLQWIDQNSCEFLFIAFSVCYSVLHVALFSFCVSALLQRRVEEVARQADLRRKEQERNFRLAYD